MTYILNEEQFEKLAEKFILSNIHDVLAGEASSDTIRYFIGQVAHKIKSQIPWSEWTKEELHIASILSTISVGEDPSIAFGLKTNHRKRTDAGKKRAVALHVWKLVNINKFSLKKAIIIVSNETKYWDISAWTAKKYYNRYKDDFNLEAQNILNATII